MSYGAQNSEIEDLSKKLFSSILIEQDKFDQVKEPNPNKKNTVAAMLTEYEGLKGRGFFYPYASSGRGHGPYTELIDESVKLDLIGGIGVNLLGHSHPLYIKSALEAAQQDTIMCGNLQTYPQAYELTKDLVSSVEGSRLKHFWFAGSGSFANDNALKMIWQKSAPKYRIFAFNNSFAGRSVATQNITHNQGYKVGMPENVDVTFVPHFNESDPQSSAAITLKELEDHYNQTPNEYCCVYIELIQGEGGFVFGPKDYYEQIFEWAKKKNLYIWVDEVQSFGRTKELFAFQMLGLESYVDVVTVGKALQNCGTFYTEELNPKPGLISGTFNSSMPQLIAGKKTLRYLMEGNFYGKGNRIESIENTLKSRLHLLKKGSGKNKIGYIGGIGTMICFEVGDGSKEITIDFLKALFENGIVAFYAGHGPYRVRFLLPLTLTDQHIDEIMSIIEKTLEEI